MAPWIDVQRRVCASRRDCTKSASAHHSGAGEGAGFGSTVCGLSAAQKPSWRASFAIPLSGQAQDRLR